MKKLTVLSIIAVLVLSMGIIAFADNAKETPQWYNDMMEWRREQVKEAVKNGEITEEDAQYWNEDLDRMEEYHNEYGYGPGMMNGYRRGNNIAPGRNFRGTARRGFMGGFGPGFCHRW